MFFGYFEKMNVKMLNVFFWISLYIMIIYRMIDIDLCY